MKFGAQHPEPDYRFGSISCGGHNSKSHEDKTVVRMSGFCQPLHGLGVPVVIIKHITKHNSKFLVQQVS